MNDPQQAGHGKLPALVYPGGVIRQGSLWQLKVRWVDVHGNPAIGDLAGYTARATAKTAPGGTTLFALTSSDGIAIATDTCAFTLSRTGAQTAAYTFTRGWLDFELVNGTTVISLFELPIRLDKEITA